MLFCRRLLEGNRTIPIHGAGARSPARRALLALTPVTRRQENTEWPSSRIPLSPTSPRGEMGATLLRSLNGLPTILTSLVAVLWRWIALSRNQSIARL